MKSIGIVSNRIKDPELCITKRILAVLQRHDVRPLLREDASEQLGLPQFRSEHFLTESELLIVVGGDGTLLRVVTDAMLLEKPMLCVNLGRVGFLTELEIEELEWGIHELVHGRYTIEERSMLCANTAQGKLYALNEFAIQRQYNKGLAHFHISIDDTAVDSLAADGVIIATPTGSTAYSLSAGGPIISPRVNAILITPISSHTLHSRPIIACGEEKITISSSAEAVCLFTDGYHELELKEAVEITRSPLNAKFIRLYHRNFYSLLRLKFSEWSGFED